MFIEKILRVSLISAAESFSLFPSRPSRPGVPVCFQCMSALKTSVNVMGEIGAADCMCLMSERERERERESLHHLQFSVDDAAVPMISECRRQQRGRDQLQSIPDRHSTLRHWLLQLHCRSAHRQWLLPLCGHCPPGGYTRHRHRHRHCGSVQQASVVNPFCFSSQPFLLTGALFESNNSKRSLACVPTSIAFVGIKSLEHMYSL